MRALGVTIVLALGAAVTAASAHGSALSPGGAELTDTWSVMFLVAAAVAFCCYAAALLLVRSRGGSLRVVCALTVVIQFLPLAGPLLLSRDTYSYWAYGRIVSTHTANPYERAPNDFPRDPATRAVAPAWRGAKSVYGPVFTAASAGIAAVAGRSSEVAAFLFRTVAALAGLVAAVLAAALARRKAFAAVFIGWNPLLALHLAGGGHNDAWVVVGLLGSLLLFERRRDAAGGALWIAAVAIKAPALLLLPLCTWRPRRAALVGAAACAAAIAGGATVAFGDGWLSALDALATREARFSVPSRLAAFGLGETAAFAIATGVLVSGGAWLMREAMRGRPRLALGACLLLVTSPWLLPWYAVLPVGLAAIEEDAAAQVLTLCLVAYLLPDRVPI